MDIISTLWLVIFLRLKVECHWDVKAQGMNLRKTLRVFWYSTAK